MSGLLHRCLPRVFSMMMIYPSHGRMISIFAGDMMTMWHSVSAPGLLMKTNLQAVRHTGTDHSEPDESTISGSLRISRVPKGKVVWVLYTSHQIWLKMYDSQLHLSTSNMNTVNSSTKINHVFIVSKTIYNIEPDTVQMTQKIWRKGLTLSNA